MCECCSIILTMLNAHRLPQALNLATYILLRNSISDWNLTFSNYFKLQKLCINLIRTLNVCTLYTYVLEFIEGFYAQIV